MCSGCHWAQGGVGLDQGPLGYWLQLMPGYWLWRCPGYWLNGRLDTDCKGSGIWLKLLPGYWLRRCPAYWLTRRPGEWHGDKEGRAVKE